MRNSGVVVFISWILKSLARLGMEFRGAWLARSPLGATRRQAHIQVYIHPSIIRDRHSYKGNKYTPYLGGRGDMTIVQTLTLSPQKGPQGSDDDPEIKPWERLGEVVVRP